jgi:hypothetical protein
LNRKAILVLLLFIILVGVLAYFYLRPQLPSLSIDKVYNINQTGQTILVNVTMNNVPACAGWFLYLAWNPSIITLTTGGPNFTYPAEGGPPVGLFDGPFLKSAGTTTFVVMSADNEKGETFVGEVFPGGTQSASGTGVILMMNFTILQVGITTIEMKSPTPATSNQSVVIDPQNHLVDHTESNGLITAKGPPPVWASTDFQYPLISGEVVILAAATGIVYLRTHPRPPKSARRRAELQPTIDPEDQADSD